MYGAESRFRLTAASGFLLFPFSFTLFPLSGLGLLDRFFVFLRRVKLYVPEFSDESF